MAIVFARKCINYDIPLMSITVAVATAIGYGGMTGLYGIRSQLIHCIDNTS